MWTKRYLLAIILLSISLCCPTDKTTHRVQAASNNFDCTTVTEIPQPECEALVDIYNSTDGPNWVQQGGWLVTTTPCSWFGVSCSDGSVTELDLDNDNDGNGLSGALPTTIDNLTNLTSLDLSHNQLSSVPAEIGNLSNLTTLTLGYNRLTVTGPSLLSFLTTKDNDWQATQTVAPMNLVATSLSHNSIQLSWETVEFTEKGGLYEISIATVGTFTVHDTVSDKSSNSYIITDLVPGTTYFFRIRTYTPAHDGDTDYTWDDQRNELWSEYSTTVSATTLDLASTPVVPTATPTLLPSPTPTLTPPSAPGMDLYELDDICQQARTLSTDTSNQPHSFHQEDDEDWVTFELQGGVSYRLFAESTSPHAEPQFEIYLLCDDLPEFPTSPNLGNDAELIFTAPASGQYYARLKNRDGDLFGEDVTYQLSLTTQSTGGDLAIIITGHDDEFSLQQNIFNSANRAYRTFLAGGIPKNRIRYLGLMDDAGGDERGDADHDGRSDIDTEATVENIQQVITEWAVDQADSESRVFIYLIDHGLLDYMIIQGDNDPLWVDVLDVWLTELESATGAPIAVVYEACKSGSFITDAKSLSNPKRVIITSTDDETNAFPMLNGGAHFSDAFFSAVRRGENFYDAFQQGRESSSRTQLNQSPKLDDNGDNKYTTQDGDLAKTWTLSRFSATTVRPTFSMAQAPQSIVAGEGRIEVSVSNPSAVTAVWAEVYRPDFVEPGPAENGVMPELALDRIEFSDNNGDGTFVGLYDNFTLAGSYRFVIYGQAGEDDLLMPTALEMEYERGAGPPSDDVSILSRHVVYLPVITR